MAEQFRFRPGADGGHIIGSLEAAEVQILDQLLSEVAELLQPEERPDEDPLVAMTGYSPNAEVPEDLAVLALLPHASAHDEDSAEFRRLTEFSVRSDKLEDLQRSRGLIAPGSLRLTVAEAETLARALNSAAIVLAERLEIHTEADAAAVAEIENPENDDEFRAVLYNFLGWVRGTVAAALIDAL